MSNTIQIEVQDILNVILIYDKIKVYKSSTIGGTYTEITNSGTRITLNNQDSLYTYVDVSGISTEYYKTSYYNSTSFIESSLSNALYAGTTPPLQLTNNMQVIVTLDASIMDLDGNALGQNFQYFFTTKYAPLYSSVRKVRLEIGSFIQNLDDETINFAVFEASLAADQLGWVKSTSDFYIWARREWVTCTASQHLMQNFITGLKSKKLHNLEVEYDLIKPSEIMLKKLDDCVIKWEKEIKSGGHAIQTSSYVIKGETDPEAPHVGRMWEKGPFTPKVGMSNLRYRPMGARRYIGGYRRMYSKMYGNF